ncbi:kinesin motor domain-containing protein, partial [Protomyces lactucae-debilis]
IYDACVKRLVAGVLEGYHGTVFAYGMTGTGKTYSMQGVSDSPGIIPQAVTDIFQQIEADTASRYIIRVSYLEIYNERIKDLLNADASDAEEIKIRDDPKRGIHAYPLTELTIGSASEFASIMQKGDLVRHSAATDFNAHSSRSHAVVQLVVESVPASLSLTMSNASGVAKIRTLNMIDLAGSEKAASDAERRKEGSYINKSLLTLGTVIARLTSGSQASSAHIPFRDSKLTRLLQHALSGLSLVSILATINTDVRYVMETTNTLKFASRAKFIPGRAKKAELFGGDVNLLVESLRVEVGSLRIQL